MRAGSDKSSGSRTRRNRFTVNSSVETLLCVTLLALALRLLFFDLGESSFHDFDEALYTQVAREMSSSGDWMTPRYWDLPFLHKPPLGYWLVAISQHWFPETSLEFQARLPAAVASLLLVGLVYWTTRELAGPAGALGAALVLLSNEQFLYEHAARTANLDALLSLASFAVLAFGARSHSHQGSRIISAICLSAVALLKGPIAFFPFVAVLTYLILRDRRAALSWMAWVLVSMSVIALPWHVHQLWTHGLAFWDTYVGFEILGRVGSTVSKYSEQPLVHLEAFWKSFLPWSPVLVAANVSALFAWPGAAQRTKDSRATLRLFAGFSLAFFAFLCTITSKWPWYGIPAYPALVVVGAVLVIDVARSRYAWGLPLLFAVLAASRILLLDPNSAYAPATRASFLWPLETTMLVRSAPTPAEIVFSGLIISVGALALLPACRRNRRRIAGLSIVMAAVILGLGIRTVSNVPVGHESPVRSLTRALEQEQIERVFLLGFDNEQRYEGRMDPLNSLYFLSIPDAEIVDCRRDLRCITPIQHERSALVIRESTYRKLRNKRPLENLLARHDIDTWLLSKEEAQLLEALHQEKPNP